MCDDRLILDALSDPAQLALQVQQFHFNELYPTVKHVANRYLKRRQEGGTMEVGPEEKRLQKIAAISNP